MNQNAPLFTALSICARFADLNAGPEEVAERKPGLFVYAFAEGLEEAQLHDAMRAMSDGADPDASVGRKVMGLVVGEGGPACMQFYAPDGSVLVTLDNDTPETDANINALLNKAWAEACGKGEGYAEVVQAIFGSAFEPYAIAEISAASAGARSRLFNTLFKLANDETALGKAGRMFGVKKTGEVEEIPHGTDKPATESTQH